MIAGSFALLYLLLGFLVTAFLWERLIGRVPGDEYAFGVLLCIWPFVAVLYLFRTVLGLIGSAGFAVADWFE
jgi:hypothetical protein